MSVGEPAIVKLRAIALSTVCVIHRHNAPPNQLALKNVHLCWNEPPLIVLWGYRCVNFRSHQSFSMQLKREIKGIHDSWKISWAVFLWNTFSIEKVIYISVCICCNVKTLGYYCENSIHTKKRDQKPQKIEKHWMQITEQEWQKSQSRTFEHSW